MGALRIKIDYTMYNKGHNRIKKNILAWFHLSVLGVHFYHPIISNCFEIVG